MAEKNPNGINNYYRTLPDGTEARCGVRLKLSCVPPETTTKIIVNECYKPGTIIVLFVNGDKNPYKNFYEDLGRLPKEKEQSLQALAKMAVEWCDTIIMLHSASLDDNNKPPALNPKTYSVQFGEDSITETFKTQELSEKELERLLEQLAEDRGSKMITIQNDWGSTTVGSIDPTMDDELIETAKRSDRIIIDHHVLSQKKSLE